MKKFLFLLLFCVFICLILVFFSETKTSTSTEATATKNEKKTHYNWPMEGKIISDFGDPRQNFNLGIDIDLPEGTPVYASADGELSAGKRIGEDIDLGLTIVIKHNDGSLTKYSHLKKIFIEENKEKKEIKQGELIALSGKTGDTNVPKLNFTIIKDSEPLDPLQYLPTQNTSAQSASVSYIWPVKMNIISKTGKLLFTNKDHSINETGKISSELYEMLKTTNKGIDISAPEGTPVYAATDGKIKLVAENRMLISHDGGILTFYTNIKNTKDSGNEVKQGEQIGTLINIDSDIITHLHFEIINKKGKRLNPNNFLPPKTDHQIPIKSATKISESTPKVSKSKVMYIWPVKNEIHRYNITSKFNDGRNHSGIDIGFPDGTPVYAAASGIVKTARCDKACGGFDGFICDNSCKKSYGNFVEIFHSDTNETTVYAHLESFTVSKGSPVKQGDIIGYIGHTGHTWSSHGGTGAHLHFEIKTNEEPQNPLEILPPIIR